MKEPKRWTASVVAKVAVDAATTLLARAEKRPPSPRRRGRRSKRALGEAIWVVRLAAAWVGSEGVVKMPGRTIDSYSRDHKQIRIAEQTINDRERDLAFTVGHELGHWVWFEMLGLGHTMSPAPKGHYVVEWFANVFASALLRRMPWDVELDDELGAHSRAIAWAAKEAA